MGKLEGKTALVTGANRGIGLAVAEGLAQAGATVALSARRAEDATAAARAIGGASFALPLDLADEGSCRRAVAAVLERGGGLHVLVNNGAVLLDGDHRTADLPLERFDEALRVNLRGPLLLIQLVLPAMLAQRWGRIVNVSTGMSRLGEGMSGGYPSYRISKTGLNALTRNLAAELRGTGVMVNAVDPGWVKTRMGGAAATSSVEEGADSVLWAAMLEHDGPSGELIWRRKPSPF
jgi:NAD(P)-dependent dehydrogenase (short-subunit alcohol dehydrogenase family)